MAFCIGNKIEMRKRALLEAIRFCGGVTGYSKRIKVSRTRASNWCNKPEIEIPYEYAVLTEAITQVSIERLSPNTEAANKVIRSIRANNKLTPLSVEFNSIQIGDLCYYKCVHPERSIIIGTDGVLIAGWGQLEAQKSLKQRKALVTVLDLEAIALEKRMLKEMNLDLSISEKVAIGLRLEQLIGSYQGQRNDLKGSRGIINDNILENDQLCRPGDKVVRNDSLIANLVDLGSKDTYLRAKKVYLHGDIEIIQAMDNKDLPVKKAARKIKDLSLHQLNKSKCRNKE